MDNWAERLEAWLGRVREGRRSRRGGFQPVRVGRALEAELLAGRRESILQTYVPNRYRVFLHPGDWEELRPIRRTLTVELTEYLRDLAQRHGYAFVSPPELEWVVADDQPQGSVRVEARFQEPETGPEPPVAEARPQAASPATAEPEEAWSADDPEDASCLEDEPFLTESAPAAWEAPELAGESATRSWARMEPEIEPEWEELPAGTGDEPEPLGEGSGRRYRATPEAEPSGRLVVVAGPDRGTIIPLRSREILIGRATDREPPVHVALSDRGVSRRHARLFSLAGRLLVVGGSGQHQREFRTASPSTVGWLQGATRWRWGGFGWFWRRKGLRTCEAGGLVEGREPGAGGGVTDGDS